MQIFVNVLCILYLYIASLLFTFVCKGTPRNFCGHPLLRRVSISHHYESEAKGLCENITSNYSDADKRTVIKKFSDGTIGRASFV